MSYTLTESERKRLVKDLMAVLLKYGYSPSVHAINKILDVWQRAKGDLIERFKANKDYNGNFQIVFKQNFPREIAKEVVKEFFSVWVDYIYWCKLNKIKLISTSDWVVNYGADDKYCFGGDVYSVPVNNFRAVDWLRDNWEPEREISERVARGLNRIFPELKAHAGQKATRLIGKLCKLTGYDQAPEYNTRYALLTDALSPGRIKSTVVLSVNPVDYYTMAIGKSWMTCATIDKQNDYGYRGLSSGGCGSYMEDSSTFIFYTLDGKYKGTTPELEGKIYRNLFHVNDSVMIQGRVYPKSNDGGTNLYTEFREVVQEHLFPNVEWSRTDIGKLCCAEWTRTKGCHYQDYLCFNDCNVSFQKGKEPERVVIGARHHCPACGKLHNYAKDIECEDCCREEGREEEE